MARDRLGRSLGLSVPLDSAVSAALPFWCHACYFLFPAFHFAASAVVYSGASEFYKGGDSTENDPLVSIDSGVILGNATHCFSWGGSCWWEEVSRAALSDGTKHALTSTCTDEQVPLARSNALFHVRSVTIPTHFGACLFKARLVPDNINHWP